MYSIVLQLKGIYSRYCISLISIEKLTNHNYKANCASNAGKKIIFEKEEVIERRTCSPCRVIFISFRKHGRCEQIARFTPFILRKEKSINRRPGQLTRLRDADLTFRIN